MSVPIITLSPASLARAGLFISDNVHYQCTPDELLQDTLRLDQGRLTSTGALAINTGKFTGRSPQDKFIVKDAITASTVDWNNFNIPIEETYFLAAQKRMMAYLGNRSELWIRDCYACADPRYRTNIRVVTEKPSTNLFAYNMFLRPTEEELDDFTPDWHLFSAPDLNFDPATCGTRQGNAAIISFTYKTILIAGTGYTGETKKGIFSVLNFILAHDKGVLPMHCSANMGDAGDTAIFFGLSGTGKTTLSADPARKLIGDDEHGWADDGVFNFEGGCYAKLIHLSEESEPEIYGAVRHGALVENVKFFPGTDRVNYDDGTITENSGIL